MADYPTGLDNVYKTYETVGIREDLNDLIKNISPVDTLFYSSLSEGGADQTKVEWQTDALANAAQNKHLEGNVESATAVTATSRIYNMCQIQKKSFMISNTNQKVKKAGRVSEKDYQSAKRGKELAKDVEYAFLQEVRSDGAAGTERSMRGILNWVTTNLSKDAGATLNADGTVTGGSDRSFTEAIFKGVLLNIYTAGGNPSLVYTTPTLKQVISSWASAGNYRTAVEAKKLETAVDVYVSDFGTLKIKPHRLMPAKTVLILDEAHKGKKATLRPEHRQMLGITGDNESWIIRVEHTLRDVAEGAHGRITNLIA